jgi:RND family efflux transporter MFP subunit
MQSSFSKIALPVVAIGFLLLIIAWVAGVFTDKLAPGNTPLPAPENTDTYTVVNQEQALFEWVPASIEAKQATIISSRILARIEKIHVRAGDLVEQGQLLLELEQSDLESRVEQAQSSIQSITARLTEAKQALTRAQELTTKGLLAQADLDKAQANHDSLNANLINANQALNEARTTLSFAKIKAPISGRIVDRFAEPGDTAQSGVQLLSLYNPSSLRVEANIREQLALSLNTGQALNVTIPALKQSLDAEIEEIVPAGNSGSRSFLIKSRLQFSQNLLPGMYAQVQVPAGTESILLIPKNRIATIGQLDVAWVVVDDTVERRLIRTGKSYDNDMIEVISGLAAGDIVTTIQP